MPDSASMRDKCQYWLWTSMAENDRGAIVGDPVFGADTAYSLPASLSANAGCRSRSLAGAGAAASTGSAAGS